MEYIIKYLGAGQIYKYPKISAVNLTIVKYSEIYNTIIPFFVFVLLFKKKILCLVLNYMTFLIECKIAKIMNDGSHLTLEWLNLIRTQKSGMNNSR
jgi:hypothetical protein